jgi:cell pole-organizing protein PopZ
MEEILASIRRIISEDDAPAAEAEAEPEHPEPSTAFEPAPEPDPEPEPVHEDVLELTDRVSPPVEAPVDTVGDLDVYPRGAPEPAPAPPPPPRQPEERLVSEPIASVAAGHFSHLSAAIAMPAGGVTLEDVVRELLRPLLKGWLDENLPRIVEAKVAEEVERIARSRVR